MKNFILTLCTVSMLAVNTGSSYPVEIKERTVLVVEDVAEEEIFMETPLVEKIEEFKEIVEIETVEAPSEALSAPETNFLYFDVPLDEDLQKHLYVECEARGVDPAMVVAMIQRESNFDIDAIGDNGNSLGLMQIQPRWNQDRMNRLGCLDLLDPYQNITVGVDLLSELLDEGRGEVWALMAYNGGPSYANKLSKAGTISKYASAVLKGRDEYDSSL